MDEAGSQSLVELQGGGNAKNRKNSRGRNTKLYTTSPEKGHSNRAYQTPVQGPLRQGLNERTQPQASLRNLRLRSFDHNDSQEKQREVMTASLEIVPVVNARQVKHLKSDQ